MVISGVVGFGNSVGASVTIVTIELKSFTFIVVGVSESDMKLEMVVNFNDLSVVVGVSVVVVVGFVVVVFTVFGAVVIIVGTVA